MLIRAIALSLAILVGIGTIIPLATEMAEAGSHKVRKHKKERRWKGVKKYSKRWWQLYRAQERRKKALAARKRNLKLKQLRMETAKATGDTDKAQRVAPASKATPIKKTAAVLPSGSPAPSGWQTAAATPAQLQFRVDNSSGSQVGSATITVIGPSTGTGDPRRSVGGVSTTSLRREVIDKMIRENGWVVNDYQKEISGQSVYVVVAQSQTRSGAVQSRMFYFTEVDGRIYSVATNSPVQEADRLAEESEKVINSLKSRIRPGQRASN